MQTAKIDANTLEVTKEAPIAPATVNKYDFDFLIAQKARIIADANAYRDARQKELDEVEELLAECAKLGITAKVMPEPIAEEIV